jgi:hypothetical protein
VSRCITSARHVVFSDDLALSMPSYTLGAPNYDLMQAITDTRVRATDRMVLEALKTRSPQLLQLDLLLTEYYALWLENRLLEFHLPFIWILQSLLRSFWRGVWFRFHHIHSLHKQSAFCLIAILSQWQ